MKFCSSIIFNWLILAAFNVGGQMIEIYDLDRAPEIFEEFIHTYNKNYKGSGEHNCRYEIFYERLAEINERNMDPGRPWTSTINEFTDLTATELQKIHFNDYFGRNSMKDWRPYKKISQNEVNRESSNARHHSEKIMKPSKKQ